jgi:hypothetical protein
MRRQQLDVIEPQRASASMALESRDLARLNGHARTEFKLHSTGVRHLQGPALKSDLGPLGGTVSLSEEFVGLEQVPVGKDA